jgi:hypothetical protein
LITDGSETDQGIGCRISNVPGAAPAKIFLRTGETASRCSHRSNFNHPTRIRTHHSSPLVAALLSKPPRTLSESQKYQLQPFLQFCPKAHGLRRFAMQFRAMMRWRKAGKLVAWIEAAMSSGFRFLGISRET